MGQSLLSGEKLRFLNPSVCRNTKSSQPEKKLAHGSTEKGGRTDEVKHTPPFDIRALWQTVHFGKIIRSIHLHLFSRLWNASSVPNARNLIREAFWKPRAA